MSLTVKHGVTEVRTVTDKKGEIHEAGGMRAACFVDESDTSSGNNATVIFRGTCGDFEWDDNSKGGTQPDTIQQKKALEYIEGLKEYDNITVSGHSKGGNKSQYVAIESDKVDRCVSFDGQGFSKEFLERDEERKKRVANNQAKITSISAKGDMVNCLLHAVAQNMIYIDTAKQAEFLYNHKPNIMFTEPEEMRQLEGMTLKEQEEFLRYQVKLANNCQLRGTTEQEKLPKIIHKLSVHIIETLDEPYRSYAIEGVIGGLFEEGVMKEGKFQSILSLVILGSKIDDFTFSQIKEKHGTGVELQITFLMAKTFPFLFTDDLACALKSSVKELVGTAVEKLKKLGGWIINKLEQIGAQVKQFTHEFGEAMCKFIAGAKNAWGKLKAYINGLVDDIINTGKAAVIEVENCIHRVTTAVSSFFTSMANGIKRFIVLFGKDGAIRKGIVNTWHTIKGTLQTNRDVTLHQY